MITATLFRDEARFTGFRARGHSGYAGEGQDIVCAAVSVLGCTCVNSLESLLGIVVTMHSNRDGLLDFDLPAMPEEKQEGAQLLMGALKQGLSDVRDSFPRFVKLEIKGRRE